MTRPALVSLTVALAIGSTAVVSFGRTAPAPVPAPPDLRVVADSFVALARPRPDRVWTDLSDATRSEIRRRSMVTLGGRPRAQAEAYADRHAGTPAQLATYFVGYRTIRGARARAERVLGPRFDVREFNREVIRDGTVTLASLRAKVDRWIAAGGVTHPDEVRRELQFVLDSARMTQGFPGATLAVSLPDGSIVSVASGHSDTARKIPMRVTDRLLQGSVGKTYVAAVALQLVQEGKLDLDAPISRYLGSESWFDRLPNARSITVRQLMRHTSGLVRYEFQKEASDSLKANPFKSWTPVDRLRLIFDTKAPFEAGQGWEYSDTNYIVLGMIIERLTGQPYYAELKRRVLDRFGLRHTIPSDSPDMPGVVNGYAGPKNELGGYDASIVNGRFAANPQFEWTGGGIASTTADLAHWARIMYGAKAFNGAMLAQMLDGVPARLGPNVRYGLGVILRPTALGPAYGHSGFFPGYATEMLYLPSSKTAAAVQVNITDPYPRGLVALLIRASRVALSDSVARKSQ